MSRTIKISFCNLAGELDSRIIKALDGPDIAITDAVLELIGETELDDGDSITITEIEG